MVLELEEVVVTGVGLPVVVLLVTLTEVGLRVMVVLELGGSGSGFGDGRVAEAMGLGIGAGGDGGGGREVTVVSVWVGSEVEKVSEGGEFTENELDFVFDTVLTVWTTESCLVGAGFFITTLSFTATFVACCGVCLTVFTTGLTPCTGCFFTVCFPCVVPLFTVLGASSVRGSASRISTKSTPITAKDETGLDSEFSGRTLDLDEQFERYLPGSLAFDPAEVTEYLLDPPYLRTIGGPTVIQVYGASQAMIASPLGRQSTHVKPTVRWPKGQTGGIGAIGELKGESKYQQFPKENSRKVRKI